MKFEQWIFFVFNIFLVRTPQESVNILDEILLFLGINWYSSSPRRRVYSILSSNIKDFTLKISFFRIQEKIKLHQITNYISIISLRYEISIKKIEKSIKSWLRVSNISFSYLFFKAINGRNFHLESIICNKTPFHTILKNLIDR